ncbi:MAG: 3-hydroxyacyl-CoA dehydrogenase NAD-binding domain-containing protein, partial [Anaerolineales bacterium]|nr:3-hydroxyacyl-CoA dehydrogenase NAD-binding domain-containing protein [Anaerolineales bacterium]MDW8445655.1 3-hydroxyacyl-CoA dehydrogenase NAD-binding domain-containing protein [Anaerolineales bacterium]
MKYFIRHAAVIGAGTMGAAIAAHLANAGIRVTLLDIVPQKLTPEEEARGLTLADREVRNRIVREGFERALQSRPASFFTADHASLVRLGNLEDDFGSISQADWIIEAVVEDLAIKRRLMEKVDQTRSPYAIVSTNTSGIPIASIAEGRSEGFRQHFLGTHFFNPPRYLRLLEVIPTRDTLPEVIESISHFAEYRLGKGIVLCKDTPNFIANRIAFGCAAFALDYILENEYTVEEVDAITGPPIGNPKTATFRLLDLVGIDVWEHVRRNLASAIPHDAQAQKYLNSERVNNLICALLSQGRLGNKTKQGFYKEMVQPDGKKEFWSLNLKTLEYEPPQKPRFESIGKVKDEDLGKRLRTLIEAPDRAGQLVRALTYQSLAYASERIPEIAETPKPIDDAMRWGFGREAGPFETWDLLGVAPTVQAMKEAGFPPAGWVDEMLARGFSTFYRVENGRKIGVYHPGKHAYEPIPPHPSAIVLSELKGAGKRLKVNPGASLIDLGDGVLCVEFHTKVNALDDDIFNMILEAMDLAEKDYEGIVIGNDAEQFSAGANIFMIVMAAQSGMWDTLDAAVRKLQNMNLRMRYFPKPVIVAP